MTPWDEARRIAERCGEQPLPATTLSLGDALGHALAEPLTALTDLPPFDVSAMDGWAVAGAGPWLPSSGSILAGGSPEPLADGAAVLIATGAQVPAGATAVLRSEHGRVGDDGRLTDHGPVPATERRDIRAQGEECRSGEVLLDAGSPVSPAVLGLAAAAGYDQLQVHRRPTVDVLVLGDELLEDGLPHGGRVRDALSPMLPPWLHSHGATVTSVTRVPDEAELLHKAISESTADLVLTSGSTAAGPKDFLHGALSQLGARLLVDSVSVRPGHPMLLAELPGERGVRHLVGLPGNPLAAVAGLVTLAIPLLRGLGGYAGARTRRLTAVEPIPGNPRGTRLLPVVVSDAGMTPLPFDGPAMLRGLSLADGLAVVPSTGVAAGEAAEVLELGSRWTG